MTCQLGGTKNRNKKDGSPKVPQGECMATQNDFQKFLRRTKAQLNALETGLANEYDKMANSDAANSFQSIFGTSVTIWDTRLSKAAKTDHIAAWLQSRGPSETADILVALRKILAEPEYAERMFSLTRPTSKKPSQNKAPGEWFSIAENNSDAGA